MILPYFCTSFLAMRLENQEVMKDSGENPDEITGLKSQNTIP
jgi:hypothetical protein